jgi:hypothetical protein
MLQIGRKYMLRGTTSMFYRSHRGVNLSREVATSVAGGGYHDDYSYRFNLLPYAVSASLI